MKPLTIINVKDVTEKFNWKIFNDKCFPFPQCEHGQLLKTAMKNLNYLTKMYTYSCICKYENTLIEYKVQSGEDITTEKLYFLN